jgi:hypothetical protein
MWNNYIETEICGEDVDYIELAQDIVQRRSLVIAAVKHEVHAIYCASSTVQRTVLNLKVSNKALLAKTVKNSMM